MSGHGNKECIKQVIDITNPDIVIPIHGTQPNKIKELTDKAVILNDMDTLIINHKGDYKIMRNKIEYKSTTYEEVIERLKGKKLEDYTKEDTLDRYVAFSTTKELKKPEIQRLLIKHKLYNELIECIDIIEDKQVIQDLLSSNLFNDKGVYLVEGKLKHITEKLLVKDRKGNPIYYALVTIEDKNTSNLIQLKAPVLLDKEDLENYKQELKHYSENNIVALVKQKQKEPCIICYLKEYQDINYTKYYKPIS